MRQRQKAAWWDTKQGKANFGKHLAINYFENLLVGCLWARNDKMNMTFSDSFWHQTDHIANLQNQFNFPQKKRPFAIQK
jgi:hypothetical protein